MTNKQQMDKGVDEIQDRYFMYFQDHPVLIPYYIKSGGDNSGYGESSRLLVPCLTVSVLLSMKPF